MAVKRRTVWLSDEEWALLQAQARERHTTASQIIRDMWVLAADAPPEDPVQQAAFNERVVERATKTLGRNPYKEFRPVPKLGKPGKKK